MHPDTQASMAGLAIEAKAVRKSFADQQVLDGLDLGLLQGELFALVGGNGAGKTTLIKCILDFCPLDGGEIRIFGVDRSLIRARAPLAYLPERFLPPHFLTGREFLRTMAHFYGVSWQEDGAEAVCLDLDMEPSALGRPIRTLSKGMTQKLGLAACLMSGKALLLLDEPMSGLDPRARTLLKKQLLRLKESATTVFFNTHLLADVAEICDRMAVLHRGRLSFIGTPDECQTTFGGDSLEEACLRCMDAG
ncbi:MAG: ABC transporter ATP-binding protein [Magnetococcus sp. MYC-9]